MKDDQGFFVCLCENINILAILSRLTNHSINHAPAQNAIVPMIQSYAILIDVCKQIICAQNSRDLDKLIVVVLTVEKGLFAKNLDCKSAC